MFYSRISEFRGVFLKLLLEYFKELLNILHFICQGLSNDGRLEKKMRKTCSFIF